MLALTASSLVKKDFMGYLKPNPANQTVAKKLLDRMPVL